MPPLPSCVRDPTRPRLAAEEGGGAQGSRRPGAAARQRRRPERRRGRAVGTPSDGARSEGTRAGHTCWTSPPGRQRREREPAQQPVAAGAAPIADNCTLTRACVPVCLSMSMSMSMSERRLRECVNCMHDHGMYMCEDSEPAPLTSHPGQGAELPMRFFDAAKNATAFRWRVVCRGLHGSTAAPSSLVTQVVLVGTTAHAALMARG